MARTVRADNSRGRQGPVKYSLLARLRDRYKGWRDGSRNQPIMELEDLRTAHWQHLESDFHVRYLEVREEWINRTADCKQRLMHVNARLEEIRIALANSEEDYNAARSTLQDEHDRAPEFRENPIPRDEDTAKSERRARRRAKFAHGDAREELTSIRRVAMELESEQAQLRQAIDDEDNRANLAIAKAEAHVRQRLAVYRRSLVNSHGQGGGLLDAKLNAIANDWRPRALESGQTPQE